MDFTPAFLAHLLFRWHLNILSGHAKRFELSVNSASHHSNNKGGDAEDAGGDAEDAPSPPMIPRGG